jgi:hypothetical protein
MKKKSMFVFTLALLIGAVAFAQDLALGQKIDRALFTRTNEKLNDNRTMFRMISPQNSSFLLVDWNEISVNALPDGTITEIRYSEKGLSEDEVIAHFFRFLYYIPTDTAYTESKDIKLGDIITPRFLKPGTNEGVIFLGGSETIDIIFSIDIGNFERNLAQAVRDIESPSSTSASPPRQSDGSLGAVEDEPSSGGSTTPARSQSSQPSVDFGFTAHLNVYAHGWHQNLAALGIPLQLGVELELPVITLDLLGEASGGGGYGNLLEYRLGGMAELYLFKKVGLGVGYGLYGSAMNWGISTDSSEENPVNYAPPGRTTYWRFALIFRGTYKTSLYAELYGDNKWGFGLMWGRVMTD